MARKQFDTWKDKDSIFFLEVSSKLEEETSRDKEDGDESIESNLEGARR